MMPALDGENSIYRRMHDISWVTCLGEFRPMFKIHPSVPDTTGFEPVDPNGSLDFKASAINQLGQVSMILGWLPNPIDSFLSFYRITDNGFQPPKSYLTPQAIPWLSNSSCGVISCPDDTRFLRMDTFAVGFLLTTEKYPSTTFWMWILGSTYRPFY